jgi:hypothetical protein
MKVILSYPWLGALYWWMQGTGDYAISARSQHPHYRHLYGNAEQNVDVALATTVVFEDVIVAAADTRFPQSTSPSSEIARIASLSLTADWEARLEEQNLAGSVAKDVLEDPYIKMILRRVPWKAKAAVIEDAIVDAYLIGKYHSPLICGAGRYRIIDRLINLGVVTKEMVTGTPIFHLNEGPHSLGEEGLMATGLESYVELAALSFRSEDVPALATVKNQPVIREYAEGFQNALLRTREPGPTLNQLMTEAVHSSHVASQISGVLSFVSRGLSFLGLFPGFSAAGIPAVLTDWISVLIGAQGGRRAWYESAQLFSDMNRLRLLDSPLEAPDKSTRLACHGRALMLDAPINLSPQGGGQVRCTCPEDAAKFARMVAAVSST